MLLDTGPLVGYLNRRDQHHDWAVACWAALYDPFWTCESVLSEAIFALHSEGVDPEPIFSLIERGLIRLAFAAEEHRADVFRLLRKYSDQPMSLADACLVRMSELKRESVVFTLDTDFKVYRRHGRDAIPLIAPFAG